MKKKIFYSLLICAASSVYAQTGNEISGKYTKLVFKTNLTEPDYPTKVNGILKTDISATVKTILHDRQARKCLPKGRLFTFSSSQRQLLDKWESASYNIGKYTYEKYLLPKIWESRSTSEITGLSGYMGSHLDDAGKKHLWILAQKRRDRHHGTCRLRPRKDQLCNSYRIE